MSRDQGEARAEAGCLGVVLCGGASRRMGRDKARLELGGRSLVTVAVEALRSASDAVVLASGAAPRYADLGIEEIVDLRPGAGPLAGLEAALAHASRRGLGLAVVLACDMPRVRPALVRALVTRARARDFDVLMLQTPRGVEPLLGVYSVRCLPAVGASLDAGERRAVAFHQRDVEGSPLRVGSVAAEELGAGPEIARNLNTPEDLRQELLEPPSGPGRGGNPAADRL